MFKSNNTWLLATRSNYSYLVLIATYDGGLNNSSDGAKNMGSVVRPALYLKSNITLTGNGTNDENIYKIVR